MDGLAPVIIITLCRYEHFVRCVESLKRNSLACQTDLYIGLDYPLYEKHVKGYIQIKEYLSGLSGFNNIYVIEQKRNVGPKNNSQAVKSIVREKYTKYIFSEDDNEFSVNYLEYMNYMLNKFANNPDVVAVSGYMYPIDLQKLEKNSFMLRTYYAAFGYGIWIDKEQRLRREISMEHFKEYYFNRKKMRCLGKESRNQYCNFVKGMLGYIPELVKNNEVQLLDLSYGIYMFFNDLKMVFPVVTKVKNWGYDGSGVHCHAIESRINGKTYRTYDFSSQALDVESSYQDKGTANDYDLLEVNSKLNEFFEIPRVEMLKTKLAYNASCILGINVVKKLLKRLVKS